MRTHSHSSKAENEMRKQSANKKNIQRQDGCSMEVTSLYSVMHERIGSRFFTGMGAGYGFAASDWKKGVLAGRAREMKMGRCV